MLFELVRICLCAVTWNKGTMLLCVCQTAIVLTFHDERFSVAGFHVSPAVQQIPSITLHSILPEGWIFLPYTPSRHYIGIHGWKRRQKTANSRAIHFIRHPRTATSDGRRGWPQMIGNSISSVASDIERICIPNFRCTRSQCSFSLDGASDRI